MNRNAQLVARVSRTLASQAFTAQFSLELGLFGDKAEARRASWVDRSWPTHVDRARELLSEILPDVLLVTYRDASAALRAIEAAPPGAPLLEAVRRHAAAEGVNALADDLTELFDGPLLGAAPRRGFSSSPLAEVTCSRS